MWPLSLGYGLVADTRNLLYNRNLKPVYRAPIPVISVGNISVGGTGKTPFAEFLLAYFQERNLKPAYLSRGYGRKSKGMLMVPPDARQSYLYGDEALQVARKFPNLPVVVSEDRMKGIQQLMVTHHPDFIILDDAFQHRKVYRDLDLILLDANRLPHKDLLLPAGNLRERIRNLKRATAIIANKIPDPALVNDANWRNKLPEDTSAFCRPAFKELKPFFQSRPPLPIPTPQPVIAFSGLGNNAFFFQQLEENGFKLASTLAFPDHHFFSRKDLNKISEAVQQVSSNSTNLDAPLVVTTEKDFCRLLGNPWLDQYDHLALYYVTIELEWLEGKTHVEQLLNSLLPPKTA